MVAGLPEEDIGKFFTDDKRGSISLLNSSYISTCVGFRCAPNHYVSELIKAGYAGTMEVIREILEERDEG